MMKKPNVWLAAVVAASFVSLSAVAEPSADKYGQDDRHHFAAPGDDGASFMFRHKFRDGFPGESKLNLSEDQKKTLADIRTAEEPAQKELHQKLRSAHEDLRKAGNAGADDVTLNRLAKDFADLIAQQEVSRIKMHQKFLSILTPEQKKSLDALKAEHMNGSHKRDAKKQQ